MRCFGHDGRGGGRARREACVLTGGVLLGLTLLACARTAPVLEAPEPRVEAPAPQSPPPLPTVTVAAKKGRTYANIRLFPDGASPLIARVPVGTTLVTLGRDGEWYQVQVPTTGQLGWIRVVYLEE